MLESDLVFKGERLSSTHCFRDYFFPHTVLIVGLRMQYSREKVDAILQEKKTKQTNKKTPHSTWGSDSLKYFHTTEFWCYLSIYFPHFTETRLVPSPTKMLSSRNEEC